MIARDDPTATYQLLAAEFRARGYAAREFRLGTIDLLEVTSPHGAKWLTPIAHMSYPMQTAFTKTISIEKDLAYELVGGAGVPVPLTRVVAEDEVIADGEAEGLIARFGRLVVKPVDSTLSRGLTLNITDTHMLRSAINFARESSRIGKVLIQQQVQGEEIRFIYLDGQIIAAMLRATPKVVGDGTMTVADLIEAENKERRAIVGSMVTYPELTADIWDAGLDVTRVLGAGEVLELNRSTMIRNGASVYDVLHDVDKSYQELAHRAATAVGTDFIVIDMMIDDHTQPFDGTNAYFNEFNAAPVLKLCYSCRDGKHVDIVPRLVDTIEKRLRI